MKRLSDVLLMTVAGVVVGLLAPGSAHAADCPKDSVRAGTVCIDTYEASLWQIKPTPPATALTNQQKQVIDRIRAGTVTMADLNQAGATQLGIAFMDLVNAGCPATGNGCKDVYAVSIQGVLPGSFMTWFQALAAARNSFKRLPTNAEWQAAALGTPDPGSDDQTADCNTTTNSLSLTGARSRCVSDVGAFDMVGNVWEWVSDAIPRSQEAVGQRCGDAATSWPSQFGGDGQCLIGAATSGEPGALARGGEAFAPSAPTFDGVFSATGLNGPTTGGIEYGFRCVR
jgi:hypothetical protein